ncbi:hypothetical protein E2C01_102393 [Portunus trituberculatus]|uniref:Uncharacterized protein n=1 Tax=Portunus trituberculatus TaxID=210409 RepID=A0A5B7KP38_PORTR|nr:hypothetical protein [Portunus trituberculatus]
MSPPPSYASYSTLPAFLSPPPRPGHWER